MQELSFFLYFLPFFFFSSFQLSFFFFFFFIIWIRSVLPRFRFDKLMSLSWKFFIPFLTLIYICMVLWVI